MAQRLWLGLALFMSGCLSPNVEFGISDLSLFSPKTPDTNIIRESFPLQDIQFSSPLPYWDSTHQWVDSKYSMAVLIGGAVYECGSNPFTRKTADGKSVPCDPSALNADRRVPLPEPAVRISSGWYHTCALLKSGRVACWGLNTWGQLGVANSSLDDCSLPPGESYSLAWDSFSRIELSNLKCARTPVIVQSEESAPERDLSDVVAITAGGFHTCALKKSGGVACWGFNLEGQTGSPISQSSNCTIKIVDQSGTAATQSVSCVFRPRTVAGLERNVRKISSGGFHSCAVNAQGNVYCWGSNRFQQLGSGTQESLELSSYSPKVVMNSTGATPLKDVAQLQTSYNDSCAILNDGTAVCWGSNEYGQLGNHQLQDLPQFLKRITDTMVQWEPDFEINIFSPVSTEDTCTDAVPGLSLRDYYCYSLNSSGKMNAPSILNFGSHSARIVESRASLFPVPLSGLAEFAAVGEHSCVVTKDRHMQCWGRKGNRGTATDRTRFLAEDPTRTGLPPGNNMYRVVLTGPLVVGDTLSFHLNGTPFLQAFNTTSALTLQNLADQITLKFLEVATATVAGNAIEINSSDGFPQKSLGTTVILLDNGIVRNASPSTRGAPIPDVSFQAVQGPIRKTNSCFDALRDDPGFISAGDPRIALLDGQNTGKRCLIEPSPVKTSASSAVDLQNVLFGSAGYHHTCAVLTNGKVDCWGKGMVSDSSFQELLVAIQTKIQATLERSGQELNAPPALGIDPLAPTAKILTRSAGADDSHWTELDFLAATHSQSLDFARVPALSGGKVLKMEIGNAGSLPGLIRLTSAPTSEFRMDSRFDNLSCGLVNMGDARILQPGETCVMGVKFDPLPAQPTPNRQGDLRLDVSAIETITQRSTSLLLHLTGVSDESQLPPLSGTQAGLVLVDAKTVANCNVSPSMDQQHLTFFWDSAGGVAQTYDYLLVNTGMEAERLLVDPMNMYRQSQGAISVTGNSDPILTRAGDPTSEVHANVPGCFERLTENTRLYAGQCCKIQVKINLTDDQEVDTVQNHNSVMRAEFPIQSYTSANPTVPQFRQQLLSVSVFDGTKTSLSEILDGKKFPPFPVYFDFENTNSRPVLVYTDFDHDPQTDFGDLRLAYRAVYSSVDQNHRMIRIEPYQLESLTARLYTDPRAVTNVNPIAGTFSNTDMIFSRNGSHWDFDYSFVGTAETNVGIADFAGKLLSTPGKWILPEPNPAAPLGISPSTDAVGADGDAAGYIASSPFGYRILFFCTPGFYGGWGAAPGPCSVQPLVPLSAQANQAKRFTSNGASQIFVRAAGITITTYLESGFAYLEDIAGSTSGQFLTYLDSNGAFTLSADLTLGPAVITLKNIGPNPLRLTSETLSLGPFTRLREPTIAGSCDSLATNTIDSGGSCHVTFQFNPVAPGTYTGTFQYGYEDLVTARMSTTDPFRLSGTLAASTAMNP